MTKKILFTALFVAICSVLIWGGVNRTLAKSENTSDGSESFAARRGQIDQNNDEYIEGTEPAGGRWGQKIQSSEIDGFESNKLGGPNADGKECEGDHLTDEYAQSPELSGSEIDSVMGYQGGKNSGLTEGRGQGGRGYGQGGNGGVLK